MDTFIFMADITIKIFFFYCLIAMLIWNAATTWWIWNSTDVGSIGAILANSLLMTLPWWGYRVIKRNFSNALALASLIIFWMCFEYIHLNWQLSWPWLTLGNAFANHPGWVQWYQFTGTSGGTLWVLLINIFFYELIKRNQSAFNIQYAFIAVAAIGIPIIISVLVTPAPENTIAKNNVIIVQPNIDPYNKFQSDNIAAQINTLISLSEKQIDSNTRLVVWPETAIASPTEQQQVYNAYYCKPVFDFIKKHKNIMLVSGIESFYNLWKRKINCYCAL